MKRILSGILMLTMLLAVCAGCGSDKPQPKPSAAPAEAADEENYDTGDASLDDPRNQDEIGEQELLTVSFGTSFNDSRRLTIGGIEQSLADAFPDWSVRRAFTSQIIIDHVKSRDGVQIDNVTAALDRAMENGVRQLVVQPTHLMHGFEYNDLVDELGTYADAFDKIVVGEPLLTSDEDFAAVAKESNAVYAKMQQVLADAGHKNYFVGTVEAEPSVEDVLAMVQAGDYTRVVLRPLMIVAGDHANNDMAGDDEDSWKSIFEAAGYDVTCVVEGLGQLPEIQALFVQHAKAAIDSIK